MTRVIKFRGWDKETKCMYIPIDLSMPKKHWNWLGERDVPLMQFTGLLDKNGREIYEGDILTDDENDLFRVGWNDQNAMFSCDLIGADGKAYDEFSIEKVDGEIIGNIYENPELLKV
jgi:hypothetical protein